ncbi:MAG TPA: hypothetical protein VEA15_08065 [Caulobacteraceae bacterium]|nr:hypothetical protein [Caulobacteraceae bacterium]
MPPAAETRQPFALEVHPGEDRWHWSVTMPGKVAARGDAPNRDAAWRCGELTAAAIGAFGRIGRRRF